ncbi:MAG: LPS-assembly protein LptD, partial [Rubrivivax sp.]|nr:LPS-assembly protein LptD [Rubrivivax sp.]
MGSEALEASRRIAPLPRGDAARRLPIVLRAREIRSQPDLQTVAEGEVEFRRGGLVIRADRLAYDSPSDLASARGGVDIHREGQRYRGPELQLRVQRFEGFFLEPEFEFLELGAGGRADRIDFLDSSRSRATNASYTSCHRDGTVDPDWVLSARSVQLDLETNEGYAEGAVLRFLGLPIIALPALSFPLGDTRKSGWLPPSVGIDNRSGLVVSVPYYWNIAPNRDATLAPRIITRRGLGLDGEFRYLEPTLGGTLQLDALPDDRVAKRARHALGWTHEGTLPAGLGYRAEVLRVSDDDWWKDFPNAGRSLTPRLLAQRLVLERPFAFGSGARTEGLAYARAQQWQVLQAAEAPIASPYQRSPQIGVALRGEAAGWQFGVESEYNRFTLPDRVE